MKKLFSFVLVIMMLSSMIVLSTSAVTTNVTASVSESIDTSHISVKDAIEAYETENNVDIKSNRYYFLMPDGTNGEKGDDDTRDHEGFRYSLYYDEYAPSWYNKYTNSAGIYWFDSGIADPEYWPGYTMEPSDTENVYYADVPKEVTTIIFNNNVNSGMDPDFDIYYSSHQSGSIPCEFYYAGESPNYPDGLDSFDNMIFVIDPDLNSSFESYPSISWGGEWYYYYGDGCYGFEKDGDSTNCLRDDHNHKTIHESFAEYLGITVDEEHTYSGELYSHYEDGAQAPSWVLVNGYAGRFLPDDMLFGVFDDYYLYGCSSHPSYFNFHIYMVDEQKFYTLEDAWSMDICHKEEIFTEYLIKNNSAHLIGDADKDRKLTVMDATQIQRAEAKLCTIDDWIMASHCYGDKITLSTDFNHDGSRSVLDATAIQKKIAKLD